MTRLQDNLNVLDLLQRAASTLTEATACMAIDLTVFMGRYLWSNNDHVTTAIDFMVVRAAAVADDAPGRRFAHCGAGCHKATAGGGWQAEAVTMGQLFFCSLFASFSRQLGRTHTRVLQ